VAQHYSGDFARWPELLNANPFIRRQGDNLAPWKGELIVPEGWDFTRGHAPQPGRNRKAERAPAPPAAEPAPKSPGTTDAAVHLSRAPTANYTPDPRMSRA